MTKKRNLLFFIGFVLLPALAGCQSQGEKAKEQNQDVYIISDTIEEVSSKQEQQNENSGEELPLLQQEEEEISQPQKVIVENPSWEYFCKEGEVQPFPQAFALEQIEKEKNQIIDTEQWFEDKQLQQPTISSSQEGYSWYLEGDNYYDLYLLHLVNQTTGEETILDFSNYRYGEHYVEEDYDYISQRITYAEIENNILYVGTSHNTYSESSPETAYITAIDLLDFSILWKTKPLVSNSYSFELVGDSIICGYGFTAEKDYLYILDKGTGIVTESIPIASMAEYIIEKDGYLYVRTYDTNYCYKIVEK